MRKVITYGTFDLLHHGHVRLLERARALGDWLVVGVTSDGFDAERGKINVTQTVAERMEAVRQTGLADEILVEEYEGQKIDDVVRLDIDVFAIGSDWVGKFDYLRDYCEVVYLDRTQGVSSSQLRAERNPLRLGLLGDAPYMRKFAQECQYLDGVEAVGICGKRRESAEGRADTASRYSLEDIDDLLERSDAVYVATDPDVRISHVMHALELGKHVLCESPVALSELDCARAFELADERGLVLAEGIKTAHATAYHRLKLLLKSGIIGEVVSVGATCTSLKRANDRDGEGQLPWGSLFEWGPTALLPVYELLGTEYDSMAMVYRPSGNGSDVDSFTRIEIVYPGTVASVKVADGVKSEGELLVSGTNGYAYVPAPWWKTEYFELRYENADANRRYFYQLEGEGIRQELLAFEHAIAFGEGHSRIPREVSLGICHTMERFYERRGVTKLAI